MANLDRDKVAEFLKQFDYQRPSERQLMKIALVRSGVKELAADLYQVLPDGPDKSAVMRKLREVMMTANAAIVLGPDDAPEAVQRTGEVILGMAG